MHMPCIAHSGAHCKTATCDYFHAGGYEEEEPAREEAPEGLGLEAEPERPTKAVAFNVTVAVLARVLFFDFEGAQSPRYRYVLMQSCSYRFQRSGLDYSKNWSNC